MKLSYNDATKLAFAERLTSIEHLDDAQREQLAIYGALLLEANSRFNLTGAKDVDAVMPHLLDSLAVMPYIRESLVDIGSGGGLPGIPLAIACRVPTMLIDATAKKTTFLRAAITQLALSADTKLGRAETLGFDETLRESFMSATARAVALAPTVLEYTMPFVAVGGHAVLQRGMLDERERRATADAALMLGGQLIEEVALNGQRRLLIVRKERPTPLRFPRRVGVPAKRPLCLDERL